jgi:hypothetical protein
MFLPIPSLGNKYEINRNGVMRNARTKRCLRVYVNKSGSRFYSVKFNGTYIHRYVQQLIWEVHGILPKVVWFRPSISVCIQKDGGHFNFESMTQCAKFLVTREYYCFSWIKRQLHERRVEICGWKVFYYEDKRTLKNLDHGIKGRKIKNENY